MEHVAQRANDFLGHLEGPARSQAVGALSASLRRNPAIVEYMRHAPPEEFRDALRRYLPGEYAPPLPPAATGPNTEERIYCCIFVGLALFAIWGIVKILEVYGEVSPGTAVSTLLYVPAWFGLLCHAWDVRGPLAVYYG